MRRSARVAIAMVVGLIGCGAFPPGAVGQETLDASCAGPREFSFASMQGGNGRFAQTFASGATGAITAAQVDVTKQGTPGDYVLQINEVDDAGVPTNAVLASTVIPDSTVPAGDSLLSASFAAPAQVTAGEQYALIVTRPGSSGLRTGNRAGDDCAGRFFFSGSQVDAFNPLDPYDLIFAVFITTADQAAPQTAITDGPKNRTRRKRARFEFTGTDARVIASFECSLDGAAFTACASPHTVRVKRGRHTFQARAVDQAGNVGAAASDEWKVKKKRR